MKTSNTYTAEICMAGDIDDAKRVVRRFCLDVGLCVTITPTVFIYSGGEEVGFIVRLVNYPRFPATGGKIKATALRLAAELQDALAQYSYMVITPDQTLWDTIRKEVL